MRCDPAGGVRPPSRPRWWGLLVAMTAMAAMSAAMTGAARAQAPIAPEQALLVCGGEEVRLYDLGVEGGAVRWSWSARGDARLPEDFKRGLFDKIDECKPVLDGQAVLVTASTDGVALVDRRTGQATFWARVAMAHSAELLPGGRVAVAASLSPQGDRIEVYDLAHPAAMLSATALHSGHGVVWDARRERLFALGLDDVRAYRLEDWTGAHPRLVLDQAWPLPGKRDGHDLSRHPGTDELIVTGENGVWRFDPSTGTYTPFEPLAGKHQLKSVSIEPGSGRIAFQQPEERWWAYRVRFSGPEGELPVKDLHVYKARWLSSTEP